MGALLRDASVARGPRLARDRFRPDRARRDSRWLAPRRVRDPRLRHAARHRPDRVGVRRRAGGRAQHRLRRPGRAAARHGRAQGRDRGGDGRPQDARVRADRGPGRAHQRRRPVQQADVLGERAHRVCGGAVRPRHLRRGPRRRRGSRRRRPRRGRAGRGHRRVQRRRRVPADRAGNLRAARAARGDHRAADRLPHLRRGLHPDRPRDRCARDGVPPALHPRRADRHQHDHADPRLDDRSGRRDRLLALHRHAVPAAPPRGPLPGATRPPRRAPPPAAPCSSQA